MDITAKDAIRHFDLCLMSSLEWNLDAAQVYLYAKKMIQDGKSLRDVLNTYRTAKVFGDAKKKAVEGVIAYCEFFLN